MLYHYETILSKNIELKACFFCSSFITWFVDIHQRRCIKCNNKKYFIILHHLLISLKWTKSVKINLIYFMINLVFHASFSTMKKSIELFVELFNRYIIWKQSHYDNNIIYIRRANILWSWYYNNHQIYWKPTSAHKY